MAGVAGTAELIGREVALALSMLADRLAGQGVAGLLDELGLRAPTGLVNAEVQAAAGDAATAAGKLPDLVAALTTAIDEDDAVAVLATGARLAAAVGEVGAASVRLGSALGAAIQGLGALSTAQRQHIADFAAALPSRLVELLVIEYLRGRSPAGAALLELLRVIERIEEPGVPGDPLRPPFVRAVLHLDRLPQMVIAPQDYARAVFGWGEQGFDGVLLLWSLQEFLETWLVMPTTLLVVPGRPALLEAYVLMVRVDDTTNPPGLLVDLRLPASKDFTGSYALAGAWTLTTAVGGRFVAGAQATIQPPATVVLRPPSGTAELTVRVGLGRERPDGPMLLIGVTGGTGLRATRVDFALGLTATWSTVDGRASISPTVGAQLTGGKLAVSLGNADSFLASALPVSLEVGADLAVDWDPRSGLVVRGGAGLAVSLPLTITIGPGRLERLDLDLGLTQGGLALGVRLSGSLVLGPFTAVVDGVGAQVRLGFHTGNLGPLDMEIDFLPPRGLGLSVKAGPVSGGGFVLFDKPAGRYAGALRLTLGPVGLTAIGLIDTKLPGGRSGFALLVAMNARFPPVQLAFGIALSGVGGLLALNRRIDVDALRQRFAAGAVGRLLAPEDPVRDAAVLFEELGAVFPVTPGVVVVGPTLQLTWAQLVRVDIGVFLELPGPSKVVLLGSARATIANPTSGDVYLQIRLDVLGVLDLDKKVLELDAVLVDSTLLGVFALTGGAAFRLGWGAEPYVLLSVGGVHPSFNPAPVVLPSSLTRVAMTRGRPTDVVYLRFEGYLAVTSNSFQFGAAVEIRVNLDPVLVDGSLSFDTLIQFRPFAFELSFRACLRVRIGNLTLAGVRVVGVLAGPGPVRLSGEFSIEILFFEITWSGTFTIGAGAPPPVEHVPSALPALLDELRRPSNLTAAAEDPMVVTRPADGATLPVLNPAGAVAWSQRRAPLGLLLQRFEGAPLDRYETIRASAAGPVDPVREWFAPGTFARLTDADAVNRRAFELVDGGIRFGGGADVEGPAVTRTVTVQQFRLLEPDARPVNPAPLPRWLHEAIDRREGVVDVDPGPPQLGVAGEPWAVTTPAGDVIATDLSEAQAHQLARANGLVATPAGDRVPATEF